LHVEVPHAQVLRLVHFQAVVLFVELLAHLGVIGLLYSLSFDFTGLVLDANGLGQSGRTFNHSANLHVLLPIALRRGLSQQKGIFTLH
jgi:hypothetical protein